MTKVGYHVQSAVTSHLIAPKYGIDNLMWIVGFQCLFAIRVLASCIWLIAIDSRIGIGEIAHHVTVYHV